jgi:hypothetical protein
VSPHATAAQTAADEGADFHSYQAPIREPIVLKEYPPLVVTKAGGIYAVTKYWVKNKMFYFWTPGGEAFYVPLDRVERVYPRVNTAGE